MTQEAEWMYLVGHAILIVRTPPEATSRTPRTPTHQAAEKPSHQVTYLEKAIKLTEG